MKYLVFTILVLFLMPFPVNAVEFQAPLVPEAGSEFMPDNTESFADGLWSIIKEAVAVIRPEIALVARTCLSVIAMIVLCSLTKLIPGSSNDIIGLVVTLTIGCTLLQPSNTLIHLAANTVIELSNYAKLLLPVLTASLAASGGATKSAALYTCAVSFNSAICAAISSLIVPIVYIYLFASIASQAIQNNYLEKMKAFVKWSITWGLKILLYMFSGFMTITGVVAGSVDASAVKATKLAISGMVPVVGGLLSDASEAVLIGVSMAKNAAGIYGLLAAIAIWIGPFLKISVQYLLLKLCAFLCEMFVNKDTCKLIDDFSTAMGLLLAMTGTICILLLISIVCFMKGVS